MDKSKHLKWYVDDVLPLIYEKAREEQGKEDKEQVPITKSLFTFMEESQKFSEESKYTFDDDWTRWLKLLQDSQHHPSFKDLKFKATPGAVVKFMPQELSSS